MRLYVDTGLCSDIFRYDGSIAKILSFEFIFNQTHLAFYLFIIIIKSSYKHAPPNSSLLGFVCILIFF